MHTLSIGGTCSPVKHATETITFSTVIFSSANKSFSMNIEQRSLRWNSSLPGYELKNQMKTKRQNPVWKLEMRTHKIHKQSSDSFNFLAFQFCSIEFGNIAADIHSDRIQW